MVSTISLDNIYNIYSVANSTHYPRMLGRLVVTPTEIVVLADYGNNLSRLAGDVTPRRLKALSKWLHGSHTFGASLADIKDGKYPELIPETKMANVSEKPPAPEDSEKWFKVHRDDQKAPMVLKFKEGKAYVADSDTPLSPGELGRILELAAAGKASIRHHKPVEQMVELMKALAKSDKPDEEVDDGMATHLFEDPMVPGVKNLKAFKDAAAQSGVYVMLGGNGTGAINRLHGHDVGDQALRAMGNSIRDSLDEVVGQKHQDVWRMVGDQFMANLPSHEHAARFLRTLRSKLEAIPPVGGTHRLSMNAGLGSHPMSARMALLQANQAKKSGNHLPGNTPGYAHSLIQDAEGPVPVEPAIPKQP